MVRTYDEEVNGCPSLEVRESMHNKGAKASSNEGNLTAPDDGSNELKREGDDSSKVAPDTITKMGDSSSLPSVKENSSFEAVPPENHNGQLNEKNTQDKDGNLCNTFLQRVQEKNSSPQNPNLVNIVMEAAEKALSSLKQASNTASLDSFAKEEIMNPAAEKTAGFDTDLKEVLNAWYSAGFYTGNGRKRSKVMGMGVFQAENGFKVLNPGMPNSKICSTGQARVTRSTDITGNIGYTPTSTSKLKWNGKAAISTKKLQEIKEKKRKKNVGNSSNNPSKKKLLQSPRCPENCSDVDYFKHCFKIDQLT
ncbi:hypothetical protein BC332_00872 [Capsicum chinense]|nr:hypothetical protein BC332_00872 [Capsicum chinense]